MIRPMGEADISRVIPLYLDYYNGHEDACWTEETAGRRIRQVVTCQDSFCLLMEEEGAVLGFVMGYLQQYDDLVAYYLAEIVIRADAQGKGLGGALLEELERQLKAKGIRLVQLFSVNDEMHHHFYGRQGYGDANNLVLKTKWL